METNTNIQNAINYDNIPPKDLKMLTMRAQGYPHTEIAKEVGLEVTTVRAAFAVNGRLGDTWKVFRKEWNDRIKEDAKNTLEGSVELAVSTLITLLKGGKEGHPSNTRLGASKEILDRVLGKPDTNIKFEDETDDIGKIMAKFNLTEEDLKDENRADTISKIIEGITSGADTPADEA